MYEVFVNQNLNMDTVLLMEPMALSIAKIIDIDPTPIIMGQIFASNIGGTMTMIGDPPNIMIGSAANLSFSDYTKIGMPVMIISVTVAMIFLLIKFVVFA